MSKYKIYKLVDARYRVDHPKHIRYVGVTRRTLRKRLGGHFAKRGKPGNEKDIWIRSSKTQTQEIHLIEEVDTALEANGRETFWTVYYMRQGYDLLNKRIGGYPIWGTAEDSEELDVPKIMPNDEDYLKSLLKDRAVLRDCVTLASGITQLVMEEILQENTDKIKKILEEISNPSLLKRAHAAIDRPPPIPPTGPSEEMKQELRDLGVPKEELDSISDGIGSYFASRLERLWQRGHSLQGVVDAMEETLEEKE